MEEIIKGITAGLIMALLVGPVFFALLQTSIERGVLAGILMAAGISVSDILYIVLTYSGVTHLSQNPDFKIGLALIGGLIMLVFGIGMITRPVIQNSTVISLSNTGSKFRKFAKGFILNGVNPFVLFFWLGISTLVTLHWNYSSVQSLIFFISLALTILLTDLGKVYLADRIRPAVTTRFIKNFNRGVGIVFIILGMRMLIYAVYQGDKIFFSGHFFY